MFSRLEITFRDASSNKILSSSTWGILELQLEPTVTFDPNTRCEPKSSYELLADERFHLISSVNN